MMKKSVIFTQCNVYFILWVIQLAQRSLHLLPDSISVLELFVILIWSLFHFIYANREYCRNSFIKWLNVLFLLSFTYGIIRVLNGETLQISLVDDGVVVKKTAFLLSHMQSILPIYAFFVFAQKGQLTKQTIFFYIPILLLLTIFQYRYEEMTRFANLIPGSSQDGITNNTGYKFLALIPLFFLFREKPFFQVAGMMICSIFILFSMKRGAIVIWFVIMIYSMLFYFLKHSSIWKKFLYFTVFVILAYSIYEMVINNLADNLYFQQRIEDTISGGTSGRDYIYSKLWFHFIYETDIIHFLFGNGADGTIRLIGQVAHNDYLEILINMGVLGFVVYIGFWLSLFRSRRTLRGGDDYYVATILILFLFLRSFFSISISDMVVPSSMLLGYITSVSVNKRLPN